MRRAALGAAVLLLVTGCGGSGEPQPPADGASAGASAPDGSAGGASPPDESPGESPGETLGETPGAAAYSDWERGVHVLPVDADGFGVVRPTPKALRVRRFPTADVLPPPASGRSESSVGPVTDEIRRRMGETWSPACPVALADLRYLTVSFRGFDGADHTGELVVAASVADDVVGVFEELHAAHYPIEEMRLPTTADLDAPPTGDGNNTAALVCRASRGSTTWSAHAYGLAVDVNPFLNPYRKGDLVLPERASAYLDRTRTQPGIIHDGDVVVRAFARIGWSWGGSWSSLVDYQHFSATGR